MLAVAGTAFLELQGSSPPIMNDAWFLLQPLGFGTGYILLERVLKRYPDEKYVNAMTGLKMGSMALATAAWASSAGHTLADLQPVLDSPTAMAAMTYLSVFTTAAAVAVQSYAFKRVSAADTAIIFVTEPVWAAGIALFFLGETLGPAEWLGGLLIIGACLVNELNLVNNFIEGRHDPRNAPETDPVL
jgi:drug/metabolite transporter (DMT)-like permease